MFIPVKRLKQRSHSAPWITSEIVHTIHLKESCRKKLKISNSDVLRTKFKELRTRVKRQIATAKTNFFSSLEEELKRNPKRAWSVLKFSSKKAKLPNTIFSSPVQPDHVRNPVSDPSSIANLFNKHFVSIFHREYHDPQQPSETMSQNTADQDNLSNIELSPSDLLTYLSKIDVHKATGPDGIPNRILKQTTVAIFPSLCILFNLSLKSGIFPNAWKASNI